MYLFSKYVYPTSDSILFLSIFHSLSLYTYVCASIMYSTLFLCMLFPLYSSVVVWQLFNSTVIFCEVPYLGQECTLIAGRMPPACWQQCYQSLCPALGLNVLSLLFRHWSPTVAHGSDAPTVSAPAPSHHNVLGRERDDPVRCQRKGARLRTMVVREQDSGSSIPGLSSAKFVLTACMYYSKTLSLSDLICMESMCWQCLDSQPDVGNIQWYTVWGHWLL